MKIRTTTFTRIRRLDNFIYYEPVSGGFIVPQVKLDTDYFRPGEPIPDKIIITIQEPLEALKPGPKPIT